MNRTQTFTLSFYHNQCSSTIRNHEDSWANWNVTITRTSWSVSSIWKTVSTRSTCLTFSTWLWKPWAPSWPCSCSNPSGGESKRNSLWSMTPHSLIVLIPSPALKSWHERRKCTMRMHSLSKYLNWYHREKSQLNLQQTQFNSMKGTQVMTTLIKMIIRGILGDWVLR